MPILTISTSRPSWLLDNHIELIEDLKGRHSGVVVAPYPGVEGIMGAKWRVVTPVGLSRLSLEGVGIIVFLERVAAEHIEPSLAAIRSEQRRGLRVVKLCLEHSEFYRDSPIPFIAALEGGDELSGFDLPAWKHVDAWWDQGASTRTPIEIRPAFKRPRFTLLPEQSSVRDQIRTLLGCDEALVLLPTELEVRFVQASLGSRGATVCRHGEWIPPKKHNKIVTTGVFAPQLYSASMGPFITRTVYLTGPNELDPCIPDADSILLLPWLREGEGGCRASLSDVVSLTTDPLPIVFDRVIAGDCTSNRPLHVPLPTQNLAMAVDALVQLGLVTSNGSLSPLGRETADLAYLGLGLVLSSVLARGIVATRVDKQWPLFYLIHGLAAAAVGGLFGVTPLELEAADRDRRFLWHKCLAEEGDFVSNSNVMLLRKEWGIVPLNKWIDPGKWKAATIILDAILGGVAAVGIDVEKLGRAPRESDAALICELLGKSMTMNIAKHEGLGFYSLSRFGCKGAHSDVTDGKAVFRLDPVSVLHHETPSWVSFVRGEGYSSMVAASRIDLEAQLARRTGSHWLSESGYISELEWAQSSQLRARTEEVFYLSCVSRWEPTYS